MPFESKHDGPVRQLSTCHSCGKEPSQRYTDGAWNAYANIICRKCGYGTSGQGDSKDSAMEKAAAAWENIQQLQRINSTQKYKLVDIPIVVEVDGVPITERGD